MREKLSALLALVLAMIVTPTAGLAAFAAEESSLAPAARVVRSFDPDWRFLKGDAENAQVPDFDDSAWQAVDVPHDWSIEGPYDQTNPSRRGGGYLPSGVSWYRKTFTLPADDQTRRAFIDFDGVMANGDVWLNGEHLGKQPYGYSSFRYELTDKLNYGPNKPNVLAVRTDTTQQPASRWYTGQGIYRHVRLVVADPVHVDHWGVFVSTPKIAPDEAVVHVETKVVNQADAARDVTVETTIVGPDDKPLQSVTSKPQSITPGASAEFVEDLTIEDPKLWGLDDPNLYRAVTQILVGGAVVDDESNTFGIREAKFEADTGFWLNGKNLKIKGVCLHHDGGAVGAAVPLDVWRRRLAAVKRIGANAVRTAHNPFAPEFYDLCDRMGLLVMDESFDTWTARKPNADFGYQLYFNEWWEADTRAMVLRDRNHPSIVIYSVGNEIRDNLSRPDGVERFTAQRDLIHRLDPSRPVTFALFRPSTSGVFRNGFAELMDVVGQNYNEAGLVAAHQAKPELKVICTENAHSRGAWLAVRDNPFMPSQFIWTGIDYLGEADWPNIAWGEAPIDRTCRIRPMGYERMSWWAETPMVQIFRVDPAGARRVSDWTPTVVGPGPQLNVEIYSNCEQVELILNGESLGSRSRPADDAPRNWRVTYAPGTIRAIGRNGGEVVATHELSTAGEPAKLVLETDRETLTPGFDNVAHVTVTATDRDGVRCPGWNELVKFSIDGPGTIVAVDNGDIASHEPYRATERTAHDGQCMAIVRATEPSGQITLTASWPGHIESAITIEAVGK